MIFLLSRLIAVRLVLGCVKAIDRSLPDTRKKFGRVAQLVEHSTLNRLVVGSIPTASTISNLFIINAIDGHKYCFSFNLRSLPSPINLRHDSNLDMSENRTASVLLPDRHNLCQTLPDCSQKANRLRKDSPVMGRRQEEAGHAVGPDPKLDTG
jgi:hypothetical protein